MESESLQWAKGLFMLIVLPFGSLGLYLWMRRRMRAEEIVRPPEAELFVVIAHYFNALFQFFAVIFDMNSALTLLGIAYGVFVGTLVMALIAGAGYRKRVLSRWHNGVFWAAVLYAVPGAVLALLYSPALLDMF
jgi:hypothetical protein